MAVDKKIFSKISQAILFVISIITLLTLGASILSTAEMIEKTQEMQAIDLKELRIQYDKEIDQIKKEQVILKDKFTETYQKIELDIAEIKTSQQFIEGMLREIKENARK